MAEEKPEKAIKQEAKEIINLPTCGIVMPISEIDGLPPSHWSEVLQLLISSAQEAGFTSKLVSESNFSGVIQQRIIQNLYQNELVICDVSGQNPNVMFELGLRLAFDKATIVVVDDKTKISFDTSPIEHLIYPRDLRHGKIVDFTSRLTEMIKATYIESQKDGYSTFLRHFGTFDVKGLKEKEIGVDEFVVSALQDMQAEIKSMKANQERAVFSTEGFGKERRVSIHNNNNNNNIVSPEDMILDAIDNLGLKITKNTDLALEAIIIREYIFKNKNVNIAREYIYQVLKKELKFLIDITA